MKYHRTLAVLAAASVLGVSACGDDATTADDPVTTLDTVASVPPTTHSGSHPDTVAPSAPPTSSPIIGGVLTVEMSDFEFGGLPESVPAGTKLAVENTSSIELHEVVALRISDDESRSVAELMTLPEDELGAVAGPVPAAVLLAAPGGEQIAAVGDGTLAEPGRYLLLCAIPTGVDPGDYLTAAAESAGGPPDVAGGPPHFVNGMFAELIVE
jgi:hypothetical protein